jgi:hypothetical protein
MERHDQDRFAATRIQPAQVSLSNSGETVHIHCDRAVASAIAIRLHESLGLALVPNALPIQLGLENLRDALDRALTAAAQPASVSNRPLTPYFPPGGQT